LSIVYVNEGKKTAVKTNYKLALFCALVYNSNMKIAGIQKLSLVDYPEKICCTVFTAGCNFRCPFCHNAALVTHIGEESEPLNEVLSFLQKRKNLLQAVCVSGGEPLLQHGVDDFIKQVKEMGYLVKLDTNGSMPDKLKKLCQTRLVDFVAMDIKNSKQKYAMTAGLKTFDLAPVEESVSFLLKGTVPFEFRTTVVREFHAAEDFKEIAKWIGNPDRYFLQQFVNSGDLIDGNMHGYDNNEMQQLIEQVKKYIPNARLRGV